MLTQNDTSRVVTLDWHRKYGLFSCTASSSVQEWDLKSGAVSNKYNVKVTGVNKQGNKISAIRIVPHNQVSGFLFKKIRLLLLCKS